MRPLKRLAGLAAAALLLGGGVAAMAVEVPGRAAADEIIAVEKAFEARAAEIGPVPAFRQFAAPDAIMFLPGPMPAGPYLEKASWPGVIAWRPEVVSVAPAGDLAVSMGPSMWTVDGKGDPGYYLTIWRREADGGWKFVLDRSTPGAPDTYSWRNEPATVIPALASPGEATTPEALETNLAAGLARDAPVTLLRSMDTHAWVVRSGHGAETSRMVSVRLQDDPPTMTARYLGGGMSRGGDFAWTYGESEWERDGKTFKGQYVRVWRRTPQGWQVLIDHQVTLA